jgi:6-phosphogluconolactonase (cycloisomerase 2 family)
MKRTELISDAIILRGVKRAGIACALELIALTMLTACGGGGGSSDSPPAAVSSSSSIIGSSSSSSSSSSTSSSSSSASSISPPTYKISVNVSGLAGSGLLLRINDGEILTITANGVHDFATTLLSSAAYSVTTWANPTHLNQDCSVIDGSGTVTSSNVTNIRVVCVNFTYRVGVNVSGLSGTGLVVANNGDSLTINSNSIFPFANRVPDGDRYNLSIVTQPVNPVQTCTLINGSGVVAGGDVRTPSITCTTHYPRFAFSANFNDGTISAYTVDAATGQLRHNGYVVAGGQPHSVAVHPSGKFVYVSHYLGGISGFTVGNDGRLATLFANMGCDIGCDRRGITVDPNGKFLYVAYETRGVVEAYAINTDGKLTLVAEDSSVVSPFSITIDAVSKFAYVTSYDVRPIGSGFIHAFAIQANGALSSIDTNAAADGTQASIAAGRGTHALALHPSGKFAYTADNIANTVSVFAVNATTGALTAVNSAPAGLKPRSITIDPSGRFVYVANFGGNSVSSYGINQTTGILTALPGGLVVAGTSPSSATVDPLGKFLYVNNLGSNDTTVFNIDSTTGVLSGARTIAGRNGNQEMAITQGTVPVTYTPKYAYATNARENTISQYTIDVHGTLAAMPTPSVMSRGAPFSVTVDPSGRYAFAANNSSNTVSQYMVGAHGALTPMSAPEVTTGAGPISITADPGGKYVYVANGGSNTVSQYTIVASGALTAMRSPTASLSGAPSSVTVDPTGRYAYVANSYFNSVSQYSIGANGALTPMSLAEVATGINPTSVAVDASGRYVYIANYDDDAISQYTIDTTGSLHAMSTVSIRTRANPVSITVDPGGHYVYVANQGDDSISQYAIGADGALIAMPTLMVATGSVPYFVTVDASGSYAYATNYGEHTISQYSIGDNGALRLITKTGVDSGSPRSIVTTGTIE